ncbi:hypothetical protein LEMLEM_LOCUS8307 [Lemmus lemmus]
MPNDANSTLESRSSVSAWLKAWGESHAREEAAQAGRRAAKGRRPRPGGSALLTGGCDSGRPGRPAPGTLLGRTITGSIAAARSLHSLHPTAQSGGVAETLASSDTTPPTPAQARLPGLQSACRCPAPIRCGCLQRCLIRCALPRGSIDVSLEGGIMHVKSFNSPSVCDVQKVAVHMVVMVIVMTRFYPKQTLESEIVASILRGMWVKPCLQLLLLLVLLLLLLVVVVLGAATALHRIIFKRCTK